MSLIQTIPPTKEPIHIDDIKKHLRLSTAVTVEDNMLNAYIKVARKQAENYTRRQICYATWQLSLNSFPSSAIYLPRGPLSTSASVAISYTDSSYDTQTLANGSTFFTVDQTNTIPRIYPSWNSSNENSWADLTLANVPSNIKITYTCGYTSVDPSTGISSAIPEEFLQYIRIRVGTMYKYRETITPDQFRYIPNDFHVGLLDAYVIEEVI